MQRLAYWLFGGFVFAALVGLGLNALAEWTIGLKTNNVLIELPATLVFMASFSLMVFAPVGALITLVVGLVWRKALRANRLTVLVLGSVSTAISWLLLHRAFPGASDPGLILFLTAFLLISGVGGWLEHQRWLAASDA